MASNYHSREASKNVQNNLLLLAYNSNQVGETAVNETAAFNPITYSQGKAMGCDFYNSLHTSTSNSTVNINIGQQKEQQPLPEADSSTLSKVTNPLNESGGVSETTKDRNKQLSALKGQLASIFPLQMKDCGSVKRHTWQKPSNDYIQPVQSLR